ncbi:unnamed protein product [Lathyrus sativus]|nr:unnamed protein product [Lathyrus sativus]
MSRKDGIKPTSTFLLISKPLPTTSKPLFMIFLMNITTNRRIWNSLSMDGNSELVDKISRAGYLVVERSYFALSDDETYQSLSSDLNESQRKEICACLSSFRCSNSTVDLISCPPESGKTKTLASLLFAPLKMNRRTLVSAPTNIGIPCVEHCKRIIS